MIVRRKPKIDRDLKRMFDRLLKAEDRTIPNHDRFIKNMTQDMRDKFMEYFSYKTKYDLKEYELAKRRYKNNDRLLVDNILDIITDYKDSNVWKTDHLKQVRGIYLGSMYQIKYRNYHHDPFPLALFLNDYDSTHQNFHAINIHYFVPQFRSYFIKKVLQMNKPRISSDKVPILTMNMVKRIVPNLSLAYRNYRAEEIKVIEKINHSRWNTYLQIDKRRINIKK